MAVGAIAEYLNRLWDDLSFYNNSIVEQRKFLRVQSGMGLGVGSLTV